MAECGSTSDDGIGPGNASQPPVTGLASASLSRIGQGGGRRATIVVCGMIASDPWHGGATWAVLQYVLGLQRLGHDVFLVEPMAATALVPGRGEPPGQSPHPEPAKALALSGNAAYFTEVTREFGLEGRAALLLAGTSHTVGIPYETLLDIAKRADLILNISGMLTDEALMERAGIRVYLDLDPAFNQLWNATQGVNMRFAGHTHFVTVGLEIGEPDCPVPTCGLSWIKTLQPVVLEHWPVGKQVVHDGLTTVANWRAYGSIEHGGVRYGQKAHSLREYADLPTLAPEAFILALGIHPGESADLDMLRANGWQLLDPGRVAGTPSTYREFIQGSWAELGVAKSGYVLSRCGWFSDRSACYLASGRPVIAQETGFSRHLPTGMGLFSFRNAGDVLAALAKIREDYPAQARAARSMAETYFASDKVLGRLLGMLR